MRIQNEDTPTENKVIEKLRKKVLHVDILICCSAWREYIFASFVLLCVYVTGIGCVE